jgi:Reverse transcriptase (RNA-dependent DNA polymerase)
MQDGLQVDSIYTDFYRAFDKVRHQLLLIKLALAVPSAKCGLLRSYFSGRTQRVRIGSCVSKEIKVTSGVPQGSHFGPLCFIWFVNDIAQIFKYVRVLFYADDMKLYLQDFLKIQSDLDRLTAWCEDNMLPLNVNKCKTLTFTRSLHPVIASYVLNGKILERVCSMTNLGVIFWTANSLLESTLILSSTKVPLCLVYKALVTGIPRSLYIEGFVCHLYVRSKLEYANCVWQPFYDTHINRIERIQEKFIKHDFRQFHWNLNLDLPPYENRCRVLVMNTLKKRRDVARVLLVFDLLSGKIDSLNLLSQINLSVPSYQTRGREFLFVEFHRTNYGIYEPINAAVRGFNEFAGLFDFNKTRETFLNRIKSVS